MQTFLEQLNQKQHVIVIPQIPQIVVEREMPSRQEPQQWTVPMQQETSRSYIPQQTYIPTTVPLQTNILSNQHVLVENTNVIQPTYQLQSILPSNLFAQSAVQNVQVAQPSIFLTANNYCAIQQQNQTCEAQQQTLTRELGELSRFQNEQQSQIQLQQQQQQQQQLNLCNVPNDKPYVHVYDPEFRYMFEVPVAAIRHLPPARLNITRLVLCRNYRAPNMLHVNNDTAGFNNIHYNGLAMSNEGNNNSSNVNNALTASNSLQFGCQMGSSCKFVHADCDYSKLVRHSIHVNYIWRSPELCIYPRLPSGFWVDVHVPGSNELVERIPSDYILVTAAVRKYITTNEKNEHVPNVPLETQSTSPVNQLFSVKEVSSNQFHSTQTNTLSSTECNSASRNVESTVIWYCPHYCSNRFCQSGHDCPYVHTVYVDPRITANFKRAPSRMFGTSSHSPSSHQTFSTLYVQEGAPTNVMTSNQFYTNPTLTSQVSDNVLSNVMQLSNLQPTQLMGSNYFTNSGHTTSNILQNNSNSYHNNYEINTLQNNNNNGNAIGNVVVSNSVRSSEIAQCPQNNNQTTNTDTDKAIITGGASEENVDKHDLQCAPSQLENLNERQHKEQSAQKEEMPLDDLTDTSPLHLRADNAMNLVELRDYPDHMETPKTNKSNNSCSLPVFIDPLTEENEASLLIPSSPPHPECETHTHNNQTHFVPVNSSKNTMVVVEEKQLPQVLQTNEKCCDSCNKTKNDDQANCTSTSQTFQGHNNNNRNSKYNNNENVCDGKNVSEFRFDAGKASPESHVNMQTRSNETSDYFEQEHHEMNYVSSEVILDSFEYNVDASGTNFHNFSSNSIHGNYSSVCLGFNGSMSKECTSHNYCSNVMNNKNSNMATNNNITNNTNFGCNYCCRSNYHHKKYKDSNMYNMVTRANVSNIVTGNINNSNQTNTMYRSSTDASIMNKEPTSTLLPTFSLSASSYTSLPIQEDVDNKCSNEQFVQEAILSKKANTSNVNRFSRSLSSAKDIDSKLMRKSRARRVSVHLDNL